MDRLDEVLSKTIEGYLHYDLATMSVDGADGSGVGYPILLSTFAGIEFLGALLSEAPFQSFGKSTAYFGAYWRDYLYPSPSERAALGGTVYKLIRNGLAHSFAMKGRIGVLRKQPAFHLVRSADGTLIVDAVQLARDFMESYNARLKPRLVEGSATRSRMTTRLAELESAYEEDAERLTATLRRAPTVADLTVVAAAPGIPRFPLIS